MTPSRITAARVLRLSERLGDRDLEILMTLDRVRVATTNQIERAHFFAGTPLSNARGCRAVLNRLSRWKLLARLDRRIGGVRAGSAGFVYALGVAGQRLIGNGGPVGGRRYVRPWTPSNPFLDHRLAVTEIYVKIVERVRAGDRQLESFEAEPRAWRRFNGPGGEMVVLKPDAFIRIGSRDFVDHLFIEVDRGTESGTALSIKFDRYREYWASGHEQRRNGVFPRVLWLVPDQARREVVVDVASRQPAEAWQLFQVDEFESGAKGILGGSRG